VFLLESSPSQEAGCRADNTQFGLALCFLYTFILWKGGSWRSQSAGQGQLAVVTGQEKQQPRSRTPRFQSPALPMLGLPPSGPSAILCKDLADLVRFPVLLSPSSVTVDRSLLLWGPSFPHVFKEGRSPTLALVLTGSALVK
jgi:hypothetical protein